MFEKLRKNKRGITALILGAVIAIIMVTIIVPLGVLITYNLQTVITGLGMTADSAADNATDQVFTTAWSAYNMSAILSIVAAAGAIITIIIGVFVARPSR